MTLWAPQNCCHQCLRLHQESFTSCPFEGFKISTWMWPWLLLNSCLSAGAWTMWFCMHALRGESVFCSPPAVLYTSFAVLKPVILGAHFPSAWLLDGEPSVELGLLTILGEPPWLWLSFCLWAAHPEVWVLTVLFLLLYSSSVVPSLYLWLWEIFYACLQVILVDSCFVNSCNFAVIIGGGEFRVSLLHHLRHTFLTLEFWIFLPSKELLS